MKPSKGLKNKNLKLPILMFLIAVIVASGICGCAQTGKINLKAPSSGQMGQGMGKKMQGRNAANATNKTNRANRMQGMNGMKGMNGKNMQAGFNLSSLKAQIMSYKGGNLTPIEKRDLLHMVQEEKLAHDVYITLYDKWKLPIFQNIANSEKVHVASVELLLQKYNLTNPVKNMSVGEFANSTFTELYNKLVSEGSKNVTSALKVGALIEDMDIHDLQVCLNQTNKTDIKLVYNNLMKGSRNHMRAFISMLKKYNATYVPKYISQEEFNQIISTQTERGVGNGSGRMIGNKS